MTLPSVDNFITTYGGALVDYAPCEDPSTDRPAAAANQWYADTAAMTQTPFRALVRLQKAGVGYSITSPDQPALSGTTFQQAAVWCDGSGVIPFASFPVVAKLGVGVYTVTWPATVTDALGAVQTLNFRAAIKPSIEYSGVGSLGHANATVTAPNQLTVRLFDPTTLLPSDLNNPTILIGVI